MQNVARDITQGRGPPDDIVSLASRLKRGTSKVVDEALRLLQIKVNNSFSGKSIEKIKSASADINTVQIQPVWFFQMEMLQKNLITDVKYFSSLHDIFNMYASTTGNSYELERESSIRLLQDTGHNDCEELLKQLDCDALTVSKYFAFAARNLGKSPHFIHILLENLNYPLILHNPFRLYIVANNKRAREAKKKASAMSKNNSQPKSKPKQKKSAKDKASVPENQLLGYIVKEENYY